MVLPSLEGGGTFVMLFRINTNKNKTTQKMKKTFLLLTLSAITMTSCKKEGCTDETAINYNSKAKKNDGSCIYTSSNSDLVIPSTYVFNDANGNSTVDYSGQTDRLNQLLELDAYAESGETAVISAQILKDMFSNTNTPFTFNSSKQLKDKCFSLDVNLIESYFDSIALASQSHTQMAAPGQAGVLTSGTSKYLFDANGIEYAELIEKTIMGAVFMHQALNVYFGSEKMNVDNTTAVNPGAGQYYTSMQHHWDEAFGYFGVPIDFPSSIPSSFWGKYSNSQNAALGSNATMMNNFLKGRAAIGANVMGTRDQSITAIRNTWEAISAGTAISYLNQAISNYGSDQAKYLHVLSEAYAFAYNLRYAPLETRKMNNTEHSALMSLFGTNFWNLTLNDLNTIKSTLQAKY